MEWYTHCIRIIDANVVYCLNPMLVTLFIVKRLFKNRFQTKSVLTLIRIFILLYTLVGLVYFIIGVVFWPQDFAFIQRATGPYSLFYWLMLLSATLLPFTLLFKRFGSSLSYMILIAFMMKIGWYFERFVILTTDLHRDYLPQEVSSNTLVVVFFKSILLLTLQGFLIVLFLLCYLELVKRKKEYI